MYGPHEHTAAPRTARPRGARVVDAALVAAVLAAIALAVAGIARDPAALPAGAVASVNGQGIAAAEFDALLARVAGQLEHPPGAAERAELLARMIDEELLLQRGIALGLPRSEGRLRSLLVQEMIAHALAGVRAQPVGDAELAAFFARNVAYFARPATLRVRRYELPDAAGAEALRAALARPRDVDAMRAWEHARSPLPPDAALPPAKLREYLGDALAARIAALQPGQSLVEPLDDGRIGVFVLLARETPDAPVLASIHAEVEAEFRRRRDEQALADYIAGLRDEARILLAGADE